jgi:hypothetical protein
MTTERQLVNQIRKATNQIDFSAPMAGMIAARELDLEHAARLSEFFVAFMVYYVISKDMLGRDDQVYDFARALVLDNPTMANAYKIVKEQMNV